MTDKKTSEPVEIAFDNDPGKQATLLLAAAEDLDLDQSEVRTSGGGFLVSQEIADKAGLGKAADKPAKKTAAKKTAETKES